jgi:signal transduction histidine kinase/ligand-binding sensor domain-containing protein
LRPLLAIVLLGAGAALSAGPDDPASLARPSFRVFTDRDGLPQNTGQALAIDTRGYLWVGTQDGLGVWNGRIFRGVRLPAGARSQSVRALLSSSDGTLWVGTEGSGLFRFRDGGFGTAFPPLPGPAEVIWSMVETLGPDGEPSIWIGTAGWGLYRLRAGAWTRWEAKDGLPSGAVLAIAPARSANDPEALWVGTTEGLALLEAGSVTPVPPPPDTLRPFVKALLEVDAPGGGTQLFVGTRQGLYVLSPRGWRTPEDDPRLPRFTVNSLLDTTGPDGDTLWVATLGGGVHRIGTTDAASYGTAAGLPTNGALSLLRPRGSPDTVWLGTGGGGVVRIRLGAFRTLDRTGGLPDDAVSAIRETTDADGKRSFWVGTDAGLARFRDGRFTVLDRAAGLPDAAVTCLAPVALPAGDALWIGTEGGIARLADGRLRSFTTADGLPSNRIRALLPSGDDLWVGTQGGLARLSAGRFETWTMEQGLPTNPVTSLAETFDADGRKVLWMGTFGGGLAWLEDGEIRFVDTRAGFPDDVVLSLHLERKPAGGAWLWAATRSGAVRADPSSRPPRFSHLSDRSVPALPGRSVNQVTSDGRGRIYVLTNRGVARLTPRRPGPDDLSTYDTTVYTVDDGLPGNECFAVHLDRLGRLWVGTVGGLAVLDVSREDAKRTPKPLLLEAARVLGRDRPLEPGERLRHDENHLLFEFALLTDERESGTRFQTQLDGLEPAPTEWLPDWKREFTHLPPGSYVFRVSGRDGAGTPSGTASIAFSIAPAPWRSAWAWLLYAALSALLVGGLVQWRVHSFRDRAEALERRVEERTTDLRDMVQRLSDSEERARQASLAKSTFLANVSHELRTPLNAILGYSEILEEEVTLAGRPELTGDIRKVRAAGRHLLQLIDTILDLSKVEAGKMELHLETFPVRDLCAEVEALVSPLALKNRNRFMVRGADAAGALTSDRVKVRQALVNVAGNACKFTGDGNVTLSVVRETRLGRPEAVFVVEDDGPGIPAEQLDRLFQPFTQADSSTSRRFGGTGLGLALTRRLVSLLGGEITVRSAPGLGSAFTIRIPDGAAPPRSGAFDAPPGPPPR